MIVKAGHMMRPGPRPTLPFGTAARAGRPTPFEPGSGGPTYKQANSQGRPRRINAMKNKQVLVED